MLEINVVLLIKLNGISVDWGGKGYELNPGRGRLAEKTELGGKSFVILEAKWKMYQVRGNDQLCLGK